MSPRQSVTAKRRQEAALRAYIQTGSVKGAAHTLGVGERHIRQLLTDYCEAHGYSSVVQAVFRFGGSERGAEVTD